MLLVEKQHSMLQALTDAFPEHGWRLGVSKGSHLKPASMRHFWMTVLRRAGREAELSQLYRLSNSAVVDEGGEYLLSQYGNNVANAVAAAFPEHNWNPGHFDSGPPTAAWTLTAERRHLMQRLSRERFCFTEFSDWYRLTQKEFVSRGGAETAALLSAYDSRLQNLLEAVFPEHAWFPWLFPHVLPKFWDGVCAPFSLQTLTCLVSDMRNVESYFSWLAGRLQWQKTEDWYRISKRHFAENGGGGLLRSRYRDSTFLALSSVYPSHRWLPWKFEHMQQRWWDKVENQRQFLDWCAAELGISEPRQWKNIAIQQIINLGGEALIKNQHGGSLRRALETCYPEKQWNWT